MDNQLKIKEKIIKKYPFYKKDPIIKKTINLTSLDKLKIYQNSVITKNNNYNNNADNLLNINNNNQKEKENVNIYKQKKIKQKMPGETIHKRKIIDYIILNKKNYNSINSINIKNKQSETKENNYINNIYKENFENKKKLEELINDYSLKKKMIDDTSKYNSTNNTVQDNYTNKENKNNIIDSNYNSELNSVKKELNQESEEDNTNLTKDLNIPNYHKKRPFYALDCKIYYKNKNIEKNTPFKHKMIKSKPSFTKELNISKNNSIYTENTLGVKNRNSFRIAPINLTYKKAYRTNTNNESDNNLSINNDNNKLYIKIGRNINNKYNDTNTTENDEKEKDKNDNIIFQNYLKYDKNLKKNKNNYNDDIETLRKMDAYKMNINLNDDINVKNSRNAKKGINRKHRSFNKNSFNFLVSQTNRNKELSLSFNRRYKSKKPYINSNNDLITNDSLSYSNYYNETDNGDQESNKSSSIMYYNNNIQTDKRYHFEKDKNYQINSSHKIIPNDNLLIKNTIFKKINNNENKKPYYNRIISDNYIEFTPTSISNTNENSLKNNNNDDDKNYIFKISHKKNGVLMPNKGKIAQMKMNDPQYKLSHSKIGSLNSLGSKNNVLEKEINNSPEASLPSAGGNFYSFINLELLYFLEEKMRNTVEKIKNYEKCSEECHQYINYYFMHNFYIEELRVFKINQNREFMINYLKMELLCYFLLYNISHGDKFKEAKILLKAIFEILYNNFLIFISLIISQNQKKDSNVINVLNKIINDNIDKDNLNKILFDINNLDENKYIEIILSSSKSIDNYYKMIINNIYINNINQENNYKFLDYINTNPNELDKNKIEKIIESFFVESYQSLSNYNFDIFNKFYYSFLCTNETEEKNDKNNKDNNNENKNENNKDININNDNILEENKKNKIEKEKEKKYLLPEIKDKTFSLILDLDETIIYAQRSFNYKFRKSENNINKKRIILRPCLQEFLHDMKPLFELIIFSSGTPDYVDPIIKIIEKNEKFFDHVLYRHHISLDDEGNNVKNLDLIGRDLKKIIIIDDIPRYFHLQKRNGINIKPFCGNILSDTKTLKTLNNVLKVIRADAEETEDIRISLEKYKHLLYPNVINNIEE